MTVGYKAACTKRLRWCNNHLTHYRFDLAALALYEFTWNEYCDWYLELAKVQLQPGAADYHATHRTLVITLETTLRLLHPFMPFMTETLWQRVATHATATPPQTITQAGWPSAPESVDLEALSMMQRLQNMVNACRNLRGEMQLSPALRVPLLIESTDSVALYLPYLKTLAKLSEIHIVTQLPTLDAPVAMVDGVRLMLQVQVDRAAENARLSKEIARLDAELERLSAQLETPAFVERAPAALVAQQQKRCLELKTMRDALDTQRSSLAPGNTRA